MSGLCSHCSAQSHLTGTEREELQLHLQKPHGTYEQHTASKQKPNTYYRQIEQTFVRPIPCVPSQSHKVFGQGTCQLFAQLLCRVALCQFYLQAIEAVVLRFSDAVLLAIDNSIVVMILQAFGYVHHIAYGTLATVYFGKYPETTRVHTFAKDLVAEVVRYKHVAFVQFGYPFARDGRTVSEVMVSSWRALGIVGKVCLGLCCVVLEFEVVGHHTDNTMNLLHGRQFHAIQPVDKCVGDVHHGQLSVCSVGIMFGGVLEFLFAHLVDSEHRPALVNRTVI